MNKSLLSIGFVLALGSVGCAGFGIQPSSSLTRSYAAERGVDDLWMASEDAPPSGAETPLYAEQTLGDLWDGDAQGGTSDVDGAYRAGRGSDLWNAASPGYESRVDSDTAPRRGLLLSGAGAGLDL